MFVVESRLHGHQTEDAEVVPDFVLVTARQRAYLLREGLIERKRQFQPRYFTAKGEAWWNERLAERREVQRGP